MDTQELLRRETRTNIETWCQRSAQALYLGDSVLCRVLGKYLMYAQPTDRSLTPHLALDGYWEMWITMAIARFVQPGMTCVDVGANVGYYSVLMADWVGPTGRVIAVEPDEQNARCLLVNLEHGAARGAVYSVAASERDGEHAMTIYANHSGNHALEGKWLEGGSAGGLGEWKTRTGERVSVRNVTTRRLDTLLDGEHVDFIKIDVEGHERSVWLGMPQLLERNPQVQIACEWTPKRDPQCEIGAMAEASGFKLHEVHTDGTLKTTTREALAGSGDWKMLWFRR